jgi:hypothetical protein
MQNRGNDTFLEEFNYSRRYKAKSEFIDANSKKIKTDFIKREERHKQVAQYLRENMSEIEIAQKLGVTWQQYTGT